MQRTHNTRCLMAQQGFLPCIMRLKLRLTLQRLAQVYLMHRLRLAPRRHRRELLRLKHQMQVQVQEMPQLAKVMPLQASLMPQHLLVTLRHQRKQHQAMQQQQQMLRTA